MFMSIARVEGLLFAVVLFLLFEPLWRHKKALTETLHVFSENIRRWQVS